MMETLIIKGLILLRNFIEQILNPGSGHVQILLAVRWKFAMMKNSGSSWKSGLTSFVGQPLGKKQFIPMIIITFMYVKKRKFWFTLLLIVFIDAKKSLIQTL